MSLEMPTQTDRYHLSILQEAGTVIDVEEIRGHNNTNCPPLCWIGGSRVIRVQYQQPHLCCHFQIGQKVPDISSGIDDEGRMDPT